MFGLNDKDIAEIVSILKGFNEVEEAFIFGSRAKGNDKKGSDVDIAIKGQGADYIIAMKISGILNEETQMPYHFDVLSYKDINNQDLIEHIDRVGRILFQTVKTSSFNEPLGTYKKKSEKS